MTKEVECELCGSYITYPVRIKSTEHKKVMKVCIPCRDRIRIDNLTQIEIG